MQPLIIAVSGKKQSGKSSLCDYLKAWYRVNNELNGRFEIIQDFDGTVRYFDSSKTDILTDGENDALEADDVFPSGAESPVKVYNFADSLKEVCIKVLGMPWEQCYGTDKDKNVKTNFLWNNLPEEIRLTYSTETQDISTGHVGYNDTGDPVEFYETVKKPRSGTMTAREVMQVVGTDVFRRMFSDMIWVNATFGKIASEKKQIALVADCRFPSELNAIIANGGYVIRLNRVVDDTDQHPSETALDDYPFEKLGERCLFIENDKYSIEKKNDIATEWVSQILGARV